MHGEPLFIEPAELQKPLGRREQAGPGDRGNVAGGVREPEVADRLVRQAMEVVIGEPVVRADDHPGMLQLAVGIEQLGADGADAVDGQPARHLFEPPRLERLHIVVQMEHVRCLDVTSPEIHEARIVEHVDSAARAQHLAAERTGALELIQILKRFAIGRLIIDDEQAHEPGIDGLQQPIDASLEQLHAVTGGYDHRHRMFREGALAPV